MRTRNVLTIILTIGLLMVVNATPAMGTWYNYNWDGEGGVNNDFAWDAANPATWGNWDNDLSQATWAVNPGDTRAGFKMKSGFTSELSIDLSTYGPTESTMYIENNHTVTVKAGGILQLNGNCPYLDVKGGANSKLVIEEGGSIIATVLGDGPKGATVEFSGGDFIMDPARGDRHRFRNLDVLRIIGGNSTIQPARIGMAKNGTGSRFEFVLNDTGISPVDVVQDVFLESAGSSAVSVDISGIQDYIDGGGSYGDTLELITVGTASPLLASEFPQGFVEGSKGYLETKPDNTAYVLHIVGPRADWQVGDGAPGDWNSSDWRLGGTAWDTGGAPGGSLSAAHFIHVDAPSSNVTVTADSLDDTFSLAIGETNAGIVTVNAGVALGVSTSVTVGAGSTFNVNGDLNAGSLDTAGTTTLSGGAVGAVNVTGGAFTMSSPTVTNMSVSGGTATVAGLSVARLNVSGTGEVSSNGNIHATGNIVFAGGKLTATGAVVVSADGVVAANGTDLNITSGGSLTIPTGPGALLSGTKGYWAFKGNLNDSSGYGMNGTAVGSPTTPSDDPTPFGTGSVLDMTGGNNAVDVLDGPDNNHFDMSTALTVSYWMKGQPNGWGGRVISKNEETWVIRGNDQTKTGLRLQCDPGGGWIETHTVDNSPWQHYVWTWDSATGGKLYLDGEDVKSFGRTGSVIKSTTKALAFGHDAGGGDFGKNKLDEIYILDRKVDATEASQLYSGIFSNFGDLTMDAGTTLSMSLGGVAGDGAASFTSASVGHLVTINGDTTVVGNLFTPGGTDLTTGLTVVGDLTVGNMNGVGATVTARNFTGTGTVTFDENSELVLTASTLTVTGGITTFESGSTTSGVTAIDVAGGSLVVETSGVSTETLNVDQGATLNASIPVSVSNQATIGDNTVATISGGPAFGVSGSDVVAAHTLTLNGGTMTLADEDQAPGINLPATTLHATTGATLAMTADASDIVSLGGIEVAGDPVPENGKVLTINSLTTDIQLTNLTLGANSMVKSTAASAPANNVAITVDGTLRVDGGNAWVGDFFGPDPGSGGDQSFTNLTLTETARYEWSFTKSDAVDELWSDDGLFVVGTVNLADGLEIQLVDGGGSSAGIAGGVDVALFIPLNGAVFDPSKITVEAPDGLGWTWDTLIDGEGHEYPDLQFSDNTLVLKGLVTGVVAPHAGDANDDKIVDADDLVLFDQQFGGTPGTTGVDNCDFDGDGDVDIDDFKILKDEWGWQLSGAPDAGPGASSATPEPATMTLLGLGCLALIRRRRR